MAIYLANVRHSLHLQGASPDLSDQERELVAAAYRTALSCASVATTIRCTRSLDGVVNEYRRSAQ